MSQQELGLKLGTIEIEVFAWESDGAPKWCKDERGMLLSVKLIAHLLN